MQGAPAVSDDLTTKQKQWAIPLLFVVRADGIKKKAATTTWQLGAAV